MMLECLLAASVLMHHAWRAFAAAVLLCVKQGVKHVCS
jgi:hypothetical protein